MKAVILAGGLGTRIREETDVKPKPMIEVGGKPLLWHIMKMYSSHGIHDFVICLGYKGHAIKHFFNNYFLLMSDVTFDLQKNSITYHNSFAEPWRVTLVDTGEDTMTGGRLKRVAKYISDEEFFCLTYGDGLSDVNISDSIAFHKSHGKLATVTAYQTVGRFGLLDLDHNRVNAFREKPKNENGYINAGFFVLSPKVLDYIEGDQTVWEKEPLERLADEDQLMAYKHDNFWHCIDTLRDLQYADQLWTNGQAEWKTW